jgi:hypothetical protein
MVELRDDVLVFSFPEVHREAVLRVEFQRTLRLPDDGRPYPLPPGLGRFPVRHVDDHADRVPDAWRRHGGVMLPLYQSEAMWLNLGSPHGYPFALKVAAGKVNAVTGEAWQERLGRRPQDYVVVPDQPWLDGFVVEAGRVRQFVAMPLGGGYTVEEQLTGAAEHGGLQLLAHPLRADVWERIRRPRVHLPSYAADPLQPGLDAEDAVFAAADMGLAPGGVMEQQVYGDGYGFGDWDTSHGGRVYVHLTNSLAWLAITGVEPPTRPRTAEDYARAGLPWFDWYDADRRVLEGGVRLAGLKSVAARGRERGEAPLGPDPSVEPGPVVSLGPRRSRWQVREGTF